MIWAGSTVQVADGFFNDKTEYNKKEMEKINEVLVVGRFS